MSRRNRLRKTTLSRAYAWVAAVVLILVGLLGFARAVSWSWLPSLFHVGLGLLFGYAGLFLPRAEDVRRMIGALGVLLVAIKGTATLAILLVLGEDLFWGPTEITCFVVGLASILAAWYLRDPSPRNRR